MPESSPQVSNPPKPSNSSLLERESLSRVLELLTNQGLMEPLLQVLAAERLAHLEGSAYSSSQEERTGHIAIVKWIDAWLSGHVQAHYTQQAEDALEASEQAKRKPNGPTGGTPWMGADALSELD